MLDPIEVDVIAFRRVQLTTEDWEYYKNNVGAKIKLDIVTNFRSTHNTIKLISKMYGISMFRLDNIIEQSIKLINEYRYNLPENKLSRLLDK